jgi:hypothetical protein
VQETSIHHIETEPPLNGDWNHPCWSVSETIDVDQFRHESSNHRPTTRVRILYSKVGLHLIFRVEDQYVRSVQTMLNSAVCTDSCIEFFVKPRDDSGYLNFEINCGGALHASYIRDHTRTKAGFADITALSESDAALIGIYHSMPSTVDPEITRPTSWVNQLFIPFEVLANYVGPLGSIPGQRWRGNFYKCGDHTSHPHWAAWSPVSALNFHDPSCFGQLAFK